MRIEASDVIAALTTLVSTFVGAWLAFKWQRHLQKKNDDAANVAAGNRALITVWQQLNSLYLIQLDLIEPMRDHPGRHIVMRPQLNPAEPPRRHSVKDLGFLVEKGHKKVLFDLLLEEDRFHTATEAVRARSEMVLNVVQPRMEAAGIQEGKTYALADFEKALGVRNYTLLQQLTDAVVAHVDRTVDSLLVAKKSLREALKAIYPKGDFVDYELDPNPPPSITQPSATQQALAEGGPLYGLPQTSNSVGDICNPDTNA